MKKFGAGLIVVLIVILLIVVGVLGVVALFRYEIGLSPSKKDNLVNLSYTVPSDFREEKSTKVKKNYEYSNQLSDAGCTITIKTEEVQKDKKSLDDYTAFTPLPTKVAEFNSGMLSKEKINDTEWYTYHYIDEVEEIYYYIYYDEKDLTNNYNIEYNISWDNSENNICDKALEKFKKSLKLKK